MQVAFHTLGCKVNQYETEALKEAFVLRGAKIVNEDEFADVYIVNTCTVTNIADRKSRQYIRRMKQINPGSFVVVTGCYAQVAPEEIAEMSGVDLVVGNGKKTEICDLVFEKIIKKQFCDKTNNQIKNKLNEDLEVCEKIQVLKRDELTKYEDMGLVRSSELRKCRAYIKIQEGCDRFCAYCLIPYARGPVRSRALQQIREEALMLLDAGYKELVLTGINTALYGTEFDNPCFLLAQLDTVYPGLEKFAELSKEKLAEIKPIEMVLSMLNSLDGDFRIRLSSLEPTVVDKNDVNRIIKYEKLCHHLHLSIQSGSTNVLKLMNRRYSKDEYLEIVKAIREYDELFGITTDIIVGFPGETEEDFSETIRTATQSGFGKVHIFRYSPRAGTLGEKLSPQIPAPVKQQRALELEKTSAKITEEFYRKNLGKKHRVLVEECVKIDKKEYLTGYTGNYIRTYLPIDDTVENKSLIGQFADVILIDIFKDGCISKIC